MLDVTRLRVLVAVARYRFGDRRGAGAQLRAAVGEPPHGPAGRAETGERLLQRAGRGIRLTEAGRLLAERATEVILGRIDAAENELAALLGAA